MVEVTAIRLVGGSRHEHIESMRWTNPESGESDQSTRTAMVEFVRGGGRVYVRLGALIANIGVVESDPPYLRTHADGLWNDNLLALPRY